MRSEQYLLVVVVVPRCGLDIQNGVLYGPQLTQVSLECCLYLHQPPGNLRALLSRKVRHLHLLSIFPPGKMNLSLTDFYQVLASLDECVDLCKNAALVQDPANW